MYKCATWAIILSIFLFIIFVILIITVTTERDHSTTARGVCACLPPLPGGSRATPSAVRVGVAVGLGVAALCACAAALRLLPLGGVLRLLGRRPLLAPPLGAPVLEPHLHADTGHQVHIWFGPQVALCLHGSRSRLWSVVKITRL